MAVTYGFYNALNHDRLYDAIQVSSIFDGIIRDGIFSTIGDTMIVTSPEDGMYVNVGSGRAWFNHTWTLNDTLYPIEAEEAEVVLDRIDAVILEVNSSTAVRANSIKFLKGTPSSEPVKPTLTHNAEVNQYALAYVRIRAGQTTISQSDIENAVGTDETPLVTGVLQQVSIETLLKQWEAEFNTYFTNFKDTSTTEFNNWLAEKVSEYTAWFAQMQTNMDSNFNEFDEWFQRMKDQLNKDQAVYLQSQIDDIEDRGFYSKNLLKFTLETKTSDGVTCTNNGDGTYTLNGTASANVFFDIVLTSDFSKLGLEVGKTYKLVGCPSGGSDTGYQLKGRSVGGVFDIGNGWSFNYDSSISDYKIFIRIGSGTVCNNLVFKPMLTTDLNATYDDYVQYYKSNVELTNEKANNDIISDVWNSETIYKAGQYCIYNNSLFKCLVINQGQIPKEGIDWTKVNATNEINSINDSLGGFTPIIDDTGKITGYKTKVGADTVFPFSSSSVVARGNIHKKLKAGESYQQLINFGKEITKPKLTIEMLSKSPTLYCAIIEITIRDARLKIHNANGSYSQTIDLNWYVYEGDIS